jgi:hypothetical protein
VRRKKETIRPFPENSFTVKARTSHCFFYKLIFIRGPRILKGKKCYEFKVGLKIVNGKFNVPC